MVGIAVCGLGNWGWNVLRAFASAPGGKLLYACDLNEQTRARAAAAYPGAKAVADVAAALADPAVNAVVLAVDAPVHFKLAKAALEAGKHTYVEKPLTLTPADSKELIRLACEKGVRLMVGHLLLYHPAVLHMKRMVELGEVQPLYLYSQRVNLGVVRRNENAWWSLAPHDISVACYLLDAEPVSVSASGQCFIQPTIEDVVFASVKFNNGALAHIHVSWLDPHKMRKVTLVGSKTMVVFDDMEASEKIRVYDKGVVVKEGVSTYADAITLRSGDIHIPAIPGGEPLAMEARHFVDCVAANKTPRTDGANGLRVVRVLEAGSQSLKLGGAPVRVEGDSHASSAK